MRRVKVRLLLIPALLVLVVLTTFLSERATQPQQWAEMSKDYVRAVVQRPRKAKTRAFLWSYLPGITRDGGEADTWAWMARKQAPKRRASWGALRSVGAKASVRTNLRADRKYITSFPTAGWNNQVIEVFNNIFIALRSQRIAILPPFFPHTTHLGAEPAPIAVSDVFDLSYFVSVFERPVVEFHELKTEARTDPRLRTVVYDGEHDQLGSDGRALQVGDEIVAEEAGPDTLSCWSTSRGSEGWWGGLDPATAHFSPLPDHYRPDPSFFERQSGEKIAWLVNEANPERFANRSLPAQSIERLKELGREPPPILPDNHLTCIDTVYWIEVNADRYDLHGEWRDGYGVWSIVGQHMHFQPGLVKLAEDYLRYLWGVRQGEDLPTFMAIHIRRTDFGATWNGVSQRQWAHRAHQVLLEAKAQLISVDKVLVTTDETDDAWRAPLKALGWDFVDHAAVRTSERLGAWLPTLIDAVILSRAQVFLGLPASTMSIIARRRVIDWNHGLARHMDAEQRVPKEWEWDWDVFR